MGFSWLHFSDLHFNINENFNMAFARDTLLRILEEKQFSCDFIFITGDVANKGKYDEAKAFMPKLLERVTVSDKNNIIWAAGNHDISRSIKPKNRLITVIRDAAEDQKHAEFETAMLDESDRYTLLDMGMKDYFDNHESVIGYPLAIWNTINSHRVIKAPHANIVVLNTCITSCDNKDERNLFIAEPSMFKLFDELDSSLPTIAIGHHGKRFLNDYDANELGHLLERNVDLYLCGHSHRLGYSSFDNTERDIPEITCGGGQLDGYSTLVFMYGEYSDGEYRITPYSYSESTHQWTQNNNIHKRLQSDKWYRLDRLYRLDRSDASGTSFSSSSHSEYRDNLFERSRRYYDKLTDPRGRFAYIEYKDELFAHAQNIDIQLEDKDNKTYTIMESVDDTEKHVLFVGEGGMGKTTSLLKLWKVRLEDDAQSQLPLYVPLNEVNMERDNPFGFIGRFIAKHYSIDVNDTQEKTLLLLDGFNEIHSAQREIVR